MPLLLMRKNEIIIDTTSPTFVGFFVSRHLGLLLCNIANMKRFLPLLMLTGLLFGQDTTLVLKNGKIIEGTIVSETDNYYTIIVKSSRGGLINVDLPILGVRKDIYKIETMDRKEANAIINRNSARIKTENKIRNYNFAITAFTYCFLVPLILLMALENGSGG